MIGQPLDDLLAPDMADLDRSAVQQALVDGAQQGFQNAISDLLQPWSALTPLAEAAPADFTDVVSAIAAVFGIL
ncbi:hypothetical protein [Mycobacterium sp. SMC-11]|uniref:hypothetical protein n=1 Tax=Mycobacterium sp. SMC-11 TaxID=3385969 RepID=UPI00390CDA98